MNFVYILVFVLIGIYKYIFPTSFFINIFFFGFLFFIFYKKFIYKRSRKLEILTNLVLSIGLIFWSLGFFIILRDIHVNKNSLKKLDYVIVLGAATNKDKPRESLKARLNTAIKYYKKYPTTIFIVSGGQGSDEEYSESFVMKKHLLSKGVPEKNIIEESNSSTTLENLKFSKELTNNSNSIGVISNSFHLYRVKFFAKKMGLKIDAIYAPTPFSTLLSSYLRESLAVLYYNIKFYCP